MLCSLGSPQMNGSLSKRNTLPPANRSVRDAPRDQESLWDTICMQLHLRNPAGSQRLFEEYSQQLIQLASRHISPALKRRFDGEDVVQSVFRTFFRRLDANGLSVKRSEHLWRLLVTITLCKTRSHARKHRAECRDAQQEMPLDIDRDSVGIEASSEDAMAMWDEIENVVAGLPERTADIISCRLQGMNKTEIAAELNITRQTVHRLLRLVEDQLLDRLESLSQECSRSADGNR